MPTHKPHPKPADREEFLVDGCLRCKEYLDDFGLHFTPDRWRAFWAKMIEVEFDDDGGYTSGYDKELGRRLYLVALGIQRATGLDPRGLVYDGSQGGIGIGEVTPFELRELLSLVIDRDDRQSELTRKLIGGMLALLLEFQGFAAFARPWDRGAPRALQATTRRPTTRPALMPWEADAYALLHDACLDLVERHEREVHDGGRCEPWRAAIAAYIVRSLGLGASDFARIEAILDEYAAHAAVRDCRNNGHRG